MRFLQGVSWAKVALIGGVAVALVLLGLGLRQLVTPVERTGKPTIPISLPPPKPSSTGPSVSPSVSGSTSPSTSPSGSPSAAPNPSGPATPKSTMAATGKYVWSSLSIPAAGSVGTNRTYVVAVETSAKLKANPVATLVAETLNDPRSWTGDGKVRFSLIPDAKAADVVFYLASTKTAAALCGSAAEAAFGCATKDAVVINAERWLTPSATYGKDATAFRRFLVNHTVGHLLGQGHAACKKTGARAPIMLQQAVSLDGCVANPWPNA